ncbi:MAG: Gfo/Idh/MocA family oxidoreductase [Pseudoprimorskyibacter sp.]|nr:Gfo/Idh/MocA family oxidoreductase [Pseudoprimorskyibacter sp.]
MTKLGVGIIGCGNISAAYLKLGPLFKALDMRAVADINPEAAKARAEEFGIRAESVEGLLAAADIDVIVNLTIPEAHFDVSSRILAAGKHAYSEKPFVLSLEEGTILKDLAAAKGVRLGSAPDTFLGGSHQTARSLVDAGAVGPILSGTAHVMSRGMEQWHPNPDFFFQPGGGPILDLGPYYITNLVQLLGPVQAVTALAGRGFDTRTIGSGARAGETVPVAIDTSIHALLQFHSGAMITLGASWDVKAHRHHEMELYGAEGSLYVPDPNFFGDTVTQVSTDGTETEHTSVEHPFGVPNSHDDTKANYRCAGLADMAQAIAENRPHRCSLELALHVVDVMTSILSAGTERKWIDISTTCERPAPLDATLARNLLA